MKILHLTNKNNQSNFIKKMVVEKGFEYIFYDQDINYDLKKLQQINLVIKDRYPFDLSNDFWSKKHKILSLIPAYLPFNKGTDSNLWSFIDGTPKGGSIFFLYSSDYDIDILRRFKVNFNKNETLKTSFEKIFVKLYNELYTIFPLIINKKYPILTIDKNRGSLHTREDSKNFLEWLPEGYNTKVSEIKKMWKIFNEKL